MTGSDGPDDVVLRAGGGRLAVFLRYLGPVQGLIAMLTHRREEVVLSEEALVVRTPTGRTEYRWADILEMSWDPEDSWSSPPGPVLRVRGGAFDVPGPNAPATVARLPVYGRAAREAQEALQRSAKQHGIPWTPNLLPLVNLGKRMPRLPGERS